MITQRTAITAVAWTLTAMSFAGAARAHGPDDVPPPREVAGLPGPLVGAIEITNERDRPVQVYIDGRFALELRARTTDVVERVPNGIRLVSYAGMGRRDDDRWQTDRVEVREGRRAALRIAPLRGAAVIINQTGLRLHVIFDKIDLGMLDPGREVVTPPLPAGLYRLSAEPHGWARQRTQVQDVMIVPGEVVRAELRSFAASLVVDNPFPNKIGVWLDGQRVLRLDRFESGRLDHLEPGRARIELRRDGRVLASDLIELVPGRETRYAPHAVRHGALEVRNPTQQPVRVTIDETNGFRLDPGAVRLIPELAPGVHTIQLTTDDGRIIKHETRIDPGETARFEVPQAWLTPEPAPVRPRPR